MARSVQHRPNPLLPKKPGRRGAFKDFREREQTGLTRRLVACLRCRMHKTRCLPDLANPHGCCMTCKNAFGSAILRPICVRKKVTEAKLFVKGTHPQFIWSRRWNSMKIVNITRWANPEVKTIYVTQDVAGLSYSLRVRQFILEPGDSDRRTWKTRGREMFYKCNNYAIEDMEQTGRDVVQFADNSIKGFIDHYIDKSDPLLHQTYLMALRYTDTDANLVRTTLRLWVAIRMESKSERICGHECLGQPPQNYDPECHNYGQVLVPPVMSAQIELIATATLLNPSKEFVLRSLRKLIEANKTRAWFTIYLCLFILLHSCALLTEFENRQARKYGKSTRYVYENFVKELHHGSTILLSYFHYCNKGSHPLLMDWESSPDVHLAGLNEEQREFLKQSSELVKDKAHHFTHIRRNGKFEDPYFFLAQLYDSHWEPVRTI
ncbi:hypothetical protein QBC39DRAFT_403358 [Podospora conica]|nr:hypothetical protein QBC39DRAFT_403358 [Schizothecium conicum]